MHSTNASSDFQKSGNIAGSKYDIIMAPKVYMEGSHFVSHRYTNYTQIYLIFKKINRFPSLDNPVC